MISDKFGQFVYSENDVLDIVMQGIDIMSAKVLCNDIDNEHIIEINNISSDTIMHTVETELSIEQFDLYNQSKWHMPDKYKNLDIAEYILTLCSTEEELQRCGEELFLYQERNLFNLLRYLTYLVDLMTENNIIWGVGRGSSVASYILYKLKIHKVDSMYYKLDVGEFLR
jgi:DNA polymerase III alpha subunit